MRDNLPSKLRAAAKEWREENKVIATGATRYDAALEEAANAIEELISTTASLRRKIDRMKSAASWDEDIQRGQVQGMW